MKQLCIILGLIGTFNLCAQQMSDAMETNGVLGQVDQRIAGNDPGIEVSTKKYSVFKTQSCAEKQDLYYNYLGTYECKPAKTTSIQLTVNIHLNDPMYDEALITIVEPAKHKTDEFPIEYVELSEDGLLIFHFSISNQPHVFVLNESNKTMTWESEWGHWKEIYFYK